MTIVEKAAYLRGLTEGLGLEPESRDGKLWGALTDLLQDMAHELEDLQSNSLDFADALDEVCDDLGYLEELVCDLDVPDHSWDDYEDEYDDDFEDDEDLDNVYDLNFAEDDGDEEDEAEEEPEFDGILYDATCPSCGEEITFDEATLEEGSIRCPGCGEVLEFDLGEDE